MDVVVMNAFVLCHPKDGELLPQHEDELIRMDNLWYINCVHLLTYVDYYSQNARNK
jgi:hypothetical protein